jgi:hypothetical protein
MITAYENGSPDLPLAPGGDHTGLRWQSVQNAPLAGTLYAREWLGNIEAHHLELYSYAASTLYDSIGVDPGWHYFFISAHTSNPAAY